MPAIVKILIVFAVMLTVARLRVPLGIGLLLGGISLDFWGGQSTGEVLVHLGGALKNPELWLFVVIVAIIIEVGRFMTEEANSSEIVGAVRHWGGRHGRAFSLMALPAILGLVPMPAGALFSAPLVKQAGDRIAGKGEWKTAVNYWFRHVWEFWWPLFPGVIVGMAMFQMDTWQFIATNLFYTPLAIGAGYVFMIRPHVAELEEEPSDSPWSGRRVTQIMLPLGIVIISAIGMPFVLVKAVPNMPVQYRKMIALLAGLAIAIAMIFVDERRHGERKIFSSLREKKSWHVLVTLVGVMVFRFMLDRSGLLPVAGQELVASGIPIAVAVAVLPLLAGFVTGIAIGFTGTAFPLVVGLMSVEGAGLGPVATLALAFGFGFAGMILSPVHLCFIVSRDYFEASLLRTYRYLLPCAGVIMAAGILAFAIFSRLQW